jgi:hypothetical protein
MGERGGENGHRLFKIRNVFGRARKAWCYIDGKATKSKATQEATR